MIYNPLTQPSANIDSHLYCEYTTYINGQAILRCGYWQSAWYIHHLHIDVTIRVLLTVTPVVPKDTNQSIVILMRMFIEDVAKKRVPQTLKLSSQIVYQNVLL